MRFFKYFAIICFFAHTTGCWDTLSHLYEEMDSPIDTGKDTGSDTNLDAGMDSGPDTDTETDTAGNGQGIRPPGWENFGAPCETDKDCQGYSDRARCLPMNILGLINVPGGYCTACCDSAGSFCEGTIQCIGLDKVYLICAAQCDSHTECRQSEGYECRTIPPYLDTSPFPGTFCLPDKAHIEPNPKDEPSNPHCDWPWVEK